MTDADNDLLGQYGKGRSEAAFAELVRRHLNLVYSTALRQVAGDTHLAEDVCQAVFADLARKAAPLARRKSIAGWLYKSARFAASKAVRTEARRRARERATVAMNQNASNLPCPDSELRALIDAAMNELGDEDREAVLLRYFESRDFSAVGAALGASENAARMRVERALEKLRAILQKRGLTTTGAALAAALADSTAAPVPGGISSTVLAAALARGVAAQQAGSGWAGWKMAGAALAAASAVVIVSLATRPVSPPAAPAQELRLHTADSTVPQVANEIARPRGDPHLFEKLVQRHDAQVRAYRSTSNDWFADAMKDEPGVKKYGARLHTAVAPGQTLVCGGSRTPDGSRLLFFMTPTLAASDSPNQVVVKSTCIAVPDSELDAAGLQSLRTDGNSNSAVMSMSEETASRLLHNLGQSTGSDILNMPRISTALGCQARVASQDMRQLPGGRQYAFGPQVDFIATRATDGSSLDVVFVAFMSTPDPPDAPVGDSNQ
jgi:RNA polymerase sigma factor (sigma-70 family)